jgi:hypothetical protein
MDDFSKEIAELKQFIADLKADRVAAKEKEKREAWTKYVSLTVVIIAVGSSIASQWSAKYSGRATTNQSHAFDTWNLYESKSIKQHLDKYVSLPLLESAQPQSSEASNAIKKALGTVVANIPRYDGDKDKLTNEAAMLEAASKAAAAKGGRMGMAVSFFAVAIAMASTCLLTKKKPLWLLAIVLAAVGVAEMIISWTM